MNIIFLLNSPYPYYSGGRETWIYNVCNRICEDNEVSIITEKNYKKSNESGIFTDINQKIRIYPVKNLRNIPFLRPLLRSYLNWLSQEFSAKMMQKKLKKILDSNPQKEYFVITMDTVFMGKIGRWAKKHYSNVKYISSIRGPHAEITGTYYPILKKYFLSVEKANLVAADQIWANGWDTQMLLKEKGMNSVVVKNGLDISRVGEVSAEKYKDLPLTDDYNLITIGTLLDIKGYRELIEAIAIVNQKYKLKVNMVALGKGDPCKYESLAKSFGIADLIHFVGEKRTTIEYARKFDIAACLSGGSGLSMACLESMASKTPVIAWDTPVYRQMIAHKVSGYLVEENNADSLADGITWVLSHKDEAALIGKEAHNVAKKYDWSYVVADVIMQLERIGD